MAKHGFLAWICVHTWLRSGPTQRKATTHLFQRSSHPGAAVTGRAPPANASGPQPHPDHANPCAVTDQADLSHNSSEARVVCRSLFSSFRLKPSF